MLQFINESAVLEHVNDRLASLAVKCYRGSRIQQPQRIERVKFTFVCTQIGP